MQSAGVKAGAVSTVTDPAGDLYPLTTLFPHPASGRNVTLSGRSVTAVFPRWILGNPGSLTWYLGTYTVSDTEVQHDRIPEAAALTWGGAATSSGGDPVEPEIVPTRDLTGASIASAGASSLAFSLELAGPVTSGVSFGYASFNLDDDGRWAGVAPLSGGRWYSYIQSGNTPFPWSEAGFEDITGADVTEGTLGEIELSMTLGQAVPSGFGADDAAPTYAWFIDSVGDSATGGSGGADVNAQVRWNPAGGFEAALRVWTGTRYADLPSGVGTFTVEGNEVTMRASVAALGLSQSFRWYAAAHVTVGPPEDAYQNRVDDTSYTSMTLAGTTEVSLALESTEAWVFSLPFAASDAAFGAAVGELFISSEAHGYALDALGCEHVVCSVESVVGAVLDGWAAAGGLLRAAPLAEGLEHTAAGFTASLSTGNDRLGAVVLLDFLGAGATPASFDGPLTVCLASPGGSGPCGALRTLLGPGEVQSLPTGRSYIVVPKTTFTAPVSACVLCGDSIPAELRAAASLGGQPLQQVAVLSLETESGAAAVHLAANSRSVVEPEPQAQAQTLTAFLEFGAITAATAALKAAEPCSVEVSVREADGEISSRTTVPAVGLQSVDLGLRPPESWQLELRASCTLTARVAVEERSHRGIRPCVADETSLCLGGDRFRIEVEWQDFAGHTGAGQAVPLSGDTGYFWFFGASNLELLVKVLDGTGVNGSYWVFYGALSSVPYTLRVTDTETGAVRTYVNPSGTFASAGHTGAFASASASATASDGREAGALDGAAGEGTAGKAGSCAPTAQRLCLGDQRFAVEVAWKDFSGNTGAGQAVTLTGDTGLFWFFGASNLELAVKVLDGTPVNGHHWVFFGSLSSVEYTLTVTDTATGAIRTYRNPPGQFGSFGDTQAF